MDQKLARATSKFIVGSVIACALGMIVKFEHKIDDKIDEHYDKKRQQKDQDD